MTFWANIQQNSAAPPANQIPVNVVLPTISGATPIGSTLTCNPGEWSGVPTPSISYQWRRGSTNIAGATSSTYVTTAADQDLAITCRVTASNLAGSANSVSNAITPRAAPVATANPVITGTPAVGNVLSCSTGTFTGSAPITYAYQWLRNGVAISGATSATYTTVAADGNAAVSCRVTATNSTGSSSATSNTVTVAVVPKRPVYIGTPTRTTALTVAHTVPVGTKLLVVRVTGGATNGGGSIASATWNGAAMIRKAYALGNAGNRTMASAIFIILNPTPGSGNIVVSASGTSANRVSVENWDNVSGVSNTVAQTGGGNNASSFSHTFTKSNTLNTLVSAAGLRSGSSWTAGTGNIEEDDYANSVYCSYFGRCETENIAAASGSGGSNTFSAVTVELIAG